MGSGTTTKSLPVLVVLSFIIAQSFQHVHGGLESTIHLINELPQQSDIFRCHCFSKDDDLGFHDVSGASPFQWSFKENFWGTTLYSCHFWWASKDAAFEVYGGAIHPTKRYYPGEYFYYVRSDAFYLSREGNPTTARKVVTW